MAATFVHFTCGRERFYDRLYRGGRRHEYFVDPPVREQVPHAQSARDIHPHYVAHRIIWGHRPCVFWEREPADRDNACVQCCPNRDLLRPLYEHDQRTVPLTVDGQRLPDFGGCDDGHQLEKFIIWMIIILWNEHCEEVDF